MFDPLTKAALVTIVAFLLKLALQDTIPLSDEIFNAIALGIVTWLLSLLGYNILSVVVRKLLPRAHSHLFKSSG